MSTDEDVRRRLTGVPLGPNQDKFLACVELLRHCGAREFQIRYCEEEKPVLWMAAARWRSHWEAAAAMGPVGAVIRLVEQVVDGGKCLRCSRPTGFDPDSGPMPLDELVCWYQYDPGSKQFVRGCA